MATAKKVGTTFGIESAMDVTNWGILKSLQEDSRTSMAELGRRVGLSAPAISERVHRLEDAGIIEGYRAVINPRALGRTILAFVRISALGNVKDRVHQLVQRMPEILECHRGTGNDCFLLKVSVTSIEHLEKVTDAFTAFGSLTTSVVLSSLLTSRTIDELT
jgi:Lrp/AsnC family transcriptional regulator, leucine-responsive regulatory protein